MPADERDISWMTTGTEIRIFIAPALASFDINQTTHAKCVLKTVAPGKAKVHTLKGHIFQCVRTTGVGGADDLAPDSRPDPQKPDKPGKIVDPVKPDPGTSVVDPVKPDEQKLNKATVSEPKISCANGQEGRLHLRAQLQAGQDRPERLALRQIGCRSEAAQADRRATENQLREWHGKERRLQWRSHAQAGQGRQERLVLRKGGGRSAEEQERCKQT